MERPPSGGGCRRMRFGRGIIAAGSSPETRSLPRKPDPFLDLYEGVWEGQPLRDADCVLSTDEKTSIQARRRKHPTLPPASRRAMRVEHEYQRRGAVAYLAAWDVRRAKIFGRCEHTTGIAPFERLVSQVMAQEPYRCAPRVFWIMDNGSSHRGQSSHRRLTAKWPNIIPLHTPVHASWLNKWKSISPSFRGKSSRPMTLNPPPRSPTASFGSRNTTSKRPSLSMEVHRRDLHSLVKRLQTVESLSTPTAA